MLQTELNRSLYESRETEPRAQPSVSNIITLDEILRFLKRFGWLILAMVIVFFAAGVAYVMSIEPTYLATTQVLIESQKQSPSSWQDPGTFDLTLDNAQVESQVEVLRSESISNEVIKSLNLVNDSEFVKPDLAEPDSERLRLAMAAFNQRLNVRRLGQSYVIEVAFRSRNAKKAATIANAITDTYLRGLWRTDNRLEKFRRFTDAVQKESLAISNARVITPAATPLRPDSPKIPLTLTLATLAGLFTGTLVSLIINVSDRTIRSRAQIKSHFYVDCLGVLPRVRHARLVDASSRLFETVQWPFSPFSEALREVKISVDIADARRRTRCIGVTSLRPKEGKSTIAANLAAMFAAAGTKTLLIDGNMRNVSLSQALAPEESNGLVELLRGTADNPILFIERTKTHFLPSTGKHPVANSNDFLRSPAMVSLLKRFSSVYEVIIIDLPALQTAVDARAIGSFLDGIIFVTEWGKNHCDLISEAIDSLEGAEARIVGIILNKTPLRKISN
jgi:capsular exopolysaccharide synthesis family protein